MTVLDERPVRLRNGKDDQIIFRADREALLRAKEELGYRSVQDMIVDCIEKAVEERGYRDRLIAAQRKALKRLDGFDLTPSAEITKFVPASS
jgi:hypothetical protein